MATSKSYNSGTLEDTCTMFAPNWGFSGWTNRMVTFKFTPTDPCCHGNQAPLFDHKIGNNSACMGDTTPIPAPSKGLSGSAILSVMVKFVLDQPLLPWQRKFENFNRKFAITRLIHYIGDMSPIFAPHRGFSGSTNLIVVVKFVSDQTPSPW